MVRKRFIAIADTGQMDGRPPAKEDQCRNYGILLSQIDKDSVKSIFCMMEQKVQVDFAKVFFQVRVNFCFSTL